MKSLGAQLRQAWNALAQADLGETADRNEMLRRIGAAEAAAGAPPFVAPPRPRRLIAIASRGQAVRAALDYVREAVPRLDVDVAILTADGAGGVDSTFAEACSAHGAKVVEQTISGHFEHGLRRFVQRHPQTLFVVLGDRTMPGATFYRLPIPVVVVAELERHDAAAPSNGEQR